MSKDRNELTFDEMTRARAYFTSHAEEYISDEFTLRTILSEMGQFPSGNELTFCLEQLGGKMSFNNFCNYLSYLKNRYQRPEPKDVDTLRAFVALGGKTDRKGDISTEDLRATCRHFELTIDIDAMLKEVDEDASGTIDYSEFSSLWQPKPHEIEEEEEEQEATAASPAGLGGGAGKLTRKGSMKADEEPTLDEEENLMLVKQFLFPLQRKATVVQEALLTKRKSNLANARKSVARLPSLYPTSAAAPRKANAEPEPTQVDSEDEDEGGNVQSSPSVHAGATSAPRHSTAYRPPSPQILDFRRSKRTPRLPALTPRQPAGASVSTGRTPRTARTRY